MIVNSSKVVKYKIFGLMRDQSSQMVIRNPKQSFSMVLKIGLVLRLFSNSNAQAKLKYCRRDIN